jgi:hypothetical protein
MTETAGEPKSSDFITLIEDFDAMRIFFAAGLAAARQHVRRSFLDCWRLNLGGWLACGPSTLAGLAPGSSDLQATVTVPISALCLLCLWFCALSANQV